MLSERVDGRVVLAGTLNDGDSFFTLLTGREGIVVRNEGRNSNNGAVEVVLSDPEEQKRLSPAVLVGRGERGKRVRREQAARS